MTFKQVVESHRDGKFMELWANTLCPMAERYVRANLKPQYQSDFLNDVLQKTLLVVFYSLDKFDGSSVAFSTYLFEVAKRICLDAASSESRRIAKRTFAEPDEYATQRETKTSSFKLADETEVDSITEIVSRVIAAVREDRQLLAYLRFVEKMDYLAISKILREDVSVLTDRIRRIREKLKKNPETKGLFELAEKSRRSESNRAKKKREKI